MNEKNLTPHELKDLACKQDNIKRLTAKQKATETRKKINKTLLEAATEGKLSCFIDRPEDKYEAQALISMLTEEGFEVKGEHLTLFIIISWENPKKRELISNKQSRGGRIMERITWEDAVRCCEEVYGCFVWTGEYFNCPACGEPIYECDWKEHDFNVCPVCDFEFFEGEE